ncbi:DUF2059 domain-containing protein [Sphingomonas sp. BIUV-7]|uniref:DUF2059 domain-containing protein n=1 Tax=Sphingomonas natans TaxID=3063330 RepID=A0ABT8Y6Q3_9SPHN|nr:DUF2059 domain-containing protein [Sphingomonas sp. BIUV-7]MDO6414001.1 DUF2059 domain-containing protein [Sphingomonas sp. BIUV-7]
MRRLAVFLLAALPLPVVAQAPAAPASAAPVDPAALAAARELFEASNIRATMRDSNEKTIAQMRSGQALSVYVDQNPQMRMKRATNPQAWDAALARLGTKQAAIMEKLLAELQPEVEERTVRLYAQTFSTADLKAITAFYRTPLGHRMIEKMPIVLSQTMSWVQSEIPKRIGPSMAALQPEIQRELTPLMSTPN